MKKLGVHVWSDIACPWCYVGKRKLEAALAEFSHAESVDVVWRAFELHPSAPQVVDPDKSYIERLATKYGTTPAGAEQMIERMTNVAAEAGLDFDFSIIRPGNTFDAHRLLHHALELGVQDALKERFLKAYMTEGVAIGDREELLRLCGEVGLDVNAASGVLASTDHGDAVRADELQAQGMGVTGVPFFVIGKYGIPGAQPSELVLKFLERAWDDLPEPVLVDGAVCGPDGCDEPAAV